MTKLLKYYKPFVLLIVTAVFFILVQSFSELILPATIARVIDVGVANKDIPYIVSQGGIMLIAILITAISAVLVGFFSSRLGAKVARTLRQQIFKKITAFSSAELDKFGTSSLITRTTNDINQVQQFTVMFLRIIIMAPCMCIGGIVMAYGTNASLTKYVLMAIPVVALAIFLIGKSAVPLFSKQQEKLDKLNLITRENLTGMRVVKAFIRTDYEIERFKTANTDLTNVAIKVQRILGTMMPMLMLIMNLTAVAVMWFGGNSVAAGTLEVGSLVSFVQYIMMIMSSIAMLAMVFVMLPRAIVSAKRIDDVLVTPFSILDGELELNTSSAEISFNDVTFAYPNASEPVLKNITFTAKSGETTAFIGSTGSGKSTLISLIPRFYDITEGSISINQTDIRNVTLESLRNQIGYVQQRGVLFSGTIAENLKYGKKDATTEDLIEAATTAQSMDFIKNKEDEFEAHIAQGGANVSGGQKQRLSIARAVIKKANILIFDDSFSALDFKTDRALRTALKDKAADTTTLIVAQRVSTILDADKIVCLENGEVAGIGTHKELLKTCEVYREIASSQLTAEELEMGA